MSKVDKVVKYGLIGFGCATAAVTAVGACFDAARALKRLHESAEKSKHEKGLYERCVKRPQDLVLSSMALVGLSPIMGVIALLVKAKLGSPVLFSQERPGFNGKPFKLYKFRSMTDEQDENGELLPDEVRLTKFGKLLRSTSLDGYIIGTTPKTLVA